MSAFRTLTLLLVTLTWIGIAQAGGSCTWADAERILAQSPKILAYLNSSLDIEEVGSATRLGRHFEELGGARIGPYVFDAKPKGASGGPQFSVVIDTAPTFVDANGKALGEDADFRKATDIREQFVAVRIEPSTSLGAPAEGIGRVELSEEDSKARSKWVGDHWLEITEREHRIVKIEIEVDDEPVSGVVERRHHTDSGLIESIQVDLAIGDHGGFTEEFFYWDEQLFFVLRQENQWRFDPSKEGRTIDIVDEERLYFTEGGVYRALSKSYQANSEEDLDEARDEAKNKPLNYAEGRPAELHSRAMKLLDAVTQAEVLKVYAAE